MIRLYTLSFLFILLVSCGQNIDLFIEQSNQIYIDQLFEELVEPGQVTSYYGDSKSVHFITEEGILFVVDPSQILTSDGNQYMGQQTISVEVLDDSQEMFYNQLSTEFDGSLFNPEVAVKYSVASIDGSQLYASQSAVKCYVPGDFDDSAIIDLYNRNLDLWTESSELSELALGDFEILENEATIWSDFGYTFYTKSDVWYTVTAERSQSITNQQLCIESSYDYTNTRMFLVNTNNNSAVNVSYSTILDQFCENWTSSLRENRYKLYVISAYDEVEFGLSILDINDLTENNEINFSSTDERLDKETMLSLLSE